VGPVCSGWLLPRNQFTITATHIKGLQRDCCYTQRQIPVSNVLLTEKRFDKMEMDSTIEYHPGQRDALDPKIELRAHVHERDAGQLLAGNTDTEAEGPQTDADARQAADSNVGHWPIGF